MRCTGHAARMGQIRNEYTLIGIPEGKKPLRRPSRRWKINLKETMCDKVERKQNKM